MTEPTPGPKPNPTAPTLPSQGLNGGSSSTPSCAPTLDPGAGAPMAMPIPTVPGYEVFEELGRGGMGVVYRARHEILNRFVALKMILAGGHASPSDLKRFLAEAEAVAALQHTNIVQIFEVGQDKGLPYLVLEVVPGGSLSRKCSAGPLPAAEAAKLVSELARGIAYAHSRGVIHRDLKPDNVLIAETGIPKISDFGLAKRLEDASGTTQTGAILGTPSYMAPEQANKAKDVGRAADIYSLGAILYRLLTGRPPFLAATPLETVMQVVSDEPAPPTQLQSKIPRDLETICLKCLQKEPAKRYASADALADDLDRFSRGEPILARPVGAIERASKWVRRNPIVAGLLTAVILSLIVGTTVSYLKYRDANAQRIKAETNEKRANDEERKTKEQELLTRAALAEVETTLIDGLLRPIGQQSSASDPVEKEALGRLANLTSEDTRARFLETGLKSPQALQRLASRADVVLQAVVGLNRNQKDRVEKLLLDRWRAGESKPEIRKACLDLGLALPIDDSEFNQRSMDELMEASHKAKSSSDTYACADRLHRLLPRLKRSDTSKIAATAAISFIRTMLNATAADAYSWDAESCVRLVHLVSAADLPDVAAVLSSEAGQSDLAFGKLDATLSISKAIVSRLDAASQPRFALAILTSMVDAIRNRRDTLFSVLDVGNGEQSGINVLSKLVAPSDRVALGKNIAEKTKSCESLANARTLTSILEKFASKPPTEEESKHLREAEARRSELLKRANDFELIQYLPTVMSPEMPSGSQFNLNVSPGEAIVHAEVVVGMSGLAKQKEFSFIKPLYATFFITRLDEQGVKQLQSSIEHRLGASPKPGDAAELELLLRALELRERVLKQQPPDLTKFLALLDRPNSQNSGTPVWFGGFARRGAANADRPPTVEQMVVGISLAVLANAAAGPQFELVAREVASNFPMEHHPLKQGIMLDMLLELTKRLHTEPWPGNVALPHQLVLPLLAVDKPEHFDTVIEILARSADAMKPEEVREVLHKLEAIISKTTGHSTLKYAGEFLRTVSTKLAPGECRPLAESVARAATQEIAKLGGVSADLIEAISTITPFLDKSQASAIARRTLEGWQNSTTLRVLKLKSPDFAPLFASLSAEDLVHILKLPAANELRRSLALKQLGKIAGREFVTVWEFVAWAEKERPDLDLKSPPKMPEPNQ